MPSGWETRWRYCPGTKTDATDVATLALSVEVQPERVAGDPGEAAPQRVAPNRFELGGSRWARLLGRQHDLVSTRMFA